MLDFFSPPLPLGHPMATYDHEVAHDGFGLCLDHAPEHPSTAGALLCNLAPGHDGQWHARWCAGGMIARWGRMEGETISRVRIWTPAGVVLAHAGDVWPVGSVYHRLVPDGSSVIDTAHGPLALEPTVDEPERGSIRIAVLMLVAFLLLGGGAIVRGAQTGAQVRLSAVEQPSGELIAPLTETATTAPAAPVQSASDEAPAPAPARATAGPVPSAGTTDPTADAGAPSPAPWAPWQQIACEHLSDGIDASSGNGQPGWYPGTFPGAAVDVAPGTFRNCAAIVNPGPNNGPAQ